jgi:hypothetical protein
MSMKSSLKTIQLAGLLSADNVYRQRLCDSTDRSMDTSRLKKADCFDSHSRPVHVSVTIRMIYCTELKGQRIVRYSLLWIVSREISLPVCKLQQILFG